MKWVLCTGALYSSLFAMAPRFQGNQHWDVYGDFLYMKRSELHSVTLLKNNSHKVLQSKDLLHDFDFEPGYRVGAVYAPNGRYGFEGVFSHITSWTATEKKKAHGTLSFPFDSASYDANFTNADEAKALYKSTYWDAEFNVWRFFTDRRATYFALGGLIGARFFHWDETFKLEMEESHYNIHTNNRIIALQLGLDFQMHPTRLLSWDFMAKGGIFANNTEQKQFLGDLGDSVTVRDSSSQKWQSGWFADVSAKLAFEILKWFELHAGYEALFFTGLALAPEQVDNDVDSDAGRKDRTHGNAVIHGIVAGATFRF